MIPRFSIFIAGRLSTSASGQRRSPAILIGSVGVALAMIVMLISLSTVIGFKRQIRAKVMAFEAPLRLSASSYASDSHTPSGLIALSSELEVSIAEAAPNASVAGVIDIQTLLKTDSAFTALNLRCASDDFDWDFIRSNIIDGSLQGPSPDSSEIVISRVVASELQLNVGDRVSAHFLDDKGLKSRRFTVAAIFDTYFADYDRNMAYAGLSFANDLLNLDPSDRVFSSILLYGIHDTDIEPTSRLIAESIIRQMSSGKQILLPNIESAHQRGALYFNWLELLDTNVVVIIILMTIVSGFTLVSCLFILILQRISFIGLLKSMGCRNYAIRYIFILLTQKIVMRGLIWGNIVGLSIIFLQHFFHLIPLDPESYYLSYVPTALDPVTWGILNIGVIVIAFLVLVLPSMIISRMNTVDSIRYNSDATD